MEFHASYLHIIVPDLQHGDHRIAGEPDGIRLVGRRAENHLEVLILEEFQHQLDVVVAHLLKRLVDEDKPGGIDPGIVEHGQSRRQDQGVGNLGSGAGAVRRSS